ncbi:hypothetical protein BZL30_5120 [Mycobacterium kansasii]|uniref:Uncharacterized protein n=1 Tax=Mycobacterium kansasii TaxID=1768 RepID=A0A1V3X4T6_MYCKA|nr:hypothetical protein BZL30_5120 [Mycobacterium kansasii]
MTRSLPYFVDRPVVGPDAPGSAMSSRAGTPGHRLVAPDRVRG